MPENIGGFVDECKIFEIVAYQPPQRKNFPMGRQKQQKQHPRHPAGNGVTGKNRGRGNVVIHAVVPDRLGYPQRDADPIDHDH